MRLKTTLMGLMLSVALCGCRPGARQAGGDSKELADLRLKAEKGDAKAQCILGGVYDFGKFGVARNETEALKWYRKSADQNFAVGQYNLGACYAAGKGVAKDQKEAVHWYRKSAEQNFAPAQLDLGNCYADGAGVSKDQAAAANWYLKSAEQNVAQAQFNLGFLYATGGGVAHNINAAVKWWQKAAEQNFAPAQYDLGCCFAMGKGVTKDESAAVKWWRKAAEQNFVQAQYNLGDYYQTAQGAAKDNVEAYRWFALAALQGDENAKSNLIVIENLLTEDQIVEARRRANDWLKRHRNETPPRGAPTISRIEAKDYVGQEVVVSGRVTGLHIASKSTNVYMYFDNDDIFHPKFAAVWPGTDDPPVKKFVALIDKTISVRGRITIETNTPEIILSSWSQLTSR